MEWWWGHYESEATGTPKDLAHATELSNRKPNSDIQLSCLEVYVFLYTEWVLKLAGRKEIKSVHARDICALVFIAVLFTIAKIWKQPKCRSTEEWKKKPWYIYTTEYYSTLKKSSCHLQQYWIDLEDSMLGDISQIQR